MISIKTPEEIKLMREAGSILASVLEELRTKVAPGVTTEELDLYAEESIIKKGGLPAFKGYQGFPKTLCTSINEEVVHSIPKNITLKDGDIISIDCGVIYKGYYSDAAITVKVGEVKENIKKFIKIGEKSLMAGIREARPGNHIGDISNAIQTTIEKNGYSVVRDLVGHGVGKNLHEEPQIPNFGTKGKGPEIKPGMTFAIEIMTNMGGPDIITLQDGWTIVTRDNSLSMQAEHTVLITKNGNEILTQKKA